MISDVVTEDLARPQEINSRLTGLRYVTAALSGTATLMLIYLLGYEVTTVLWLFFAVELCWALIQISGYLFKYKNSPAYEIKKA